MDASLLVLLNLTVSGVLDPKEIYRWGQEGLKCSSWQPHLNYLPTTLLLSANVINLLNVFYAVLH